MNKYKKFMLQSVFAKQQKHFPGILANHFHRFLLLLLCVCMMTFHSKQTAQKTDHKRPSKGKKQQQQQREM